MGKTRMIRRHSSRIHSRREEGLGTSSSREEVSSSSSRVTSSMSSSVRRLANSRCGIAYMEPYLSPLLSLL
jgi:hypothetical protein